MSQRARSSPGLPARYRFAMTEPLHPVSPEDVAAEPAPTQVAAPDPTRPEARHEMPDALRADVRLLGELLGQVLTEYGGPGLLDDVERLRALSISAAVESGSDALAEAERLVDALAPRRAEEVARAFTCYFHLVNLAEEYHRVRALRQRGQMPAAAGGGATAASPPATPGNAAPPPRPAGTIPAAISQLAAEVGTEEAARRLAALEFRPVLTAHPTEARRRSVASAIRRVAVLVAERDDPRLGATALADNRRRLLAEIDALWRTAQLRPHKPSPLDEVRTAMGIFDETLFNVLPTVYRRLDDWLLGEDSGRTTPRAPAFVRVGSWIGGDRDGNPFVTASITRAAAGIASEHVLLGYEEAAARLARVLTMDDDGTPPSPELLELAARHSALLGDDAAARLDARSAGERPVGPRRRSSAPRRVPVPCSGVTRHRSEPSSTTPPNPSRASSRALTCARLSSTREEELTPSSPHGRALEGRAP